MRRGRYSLVPPVFATVPPSLMTLPPRVGPAKPEYALPPGPLPLPRPPSASPVVESPEIAPVSKNVDQHIRIQATIRLHTCAGAGIGNSSILVGDVDDVTATGTSGIQYSWSCGLRRGFFQPSIHRGKSPVFLSRGALDSPLDSVKGTP